MVINESIIHEKNGGSIENTFSMNDPLLQIDQGIEI